MKKLVILFLIILLFVSCKEDEYKVDFDEEHIKCSISSNNLVIKNNSPYPLVFDEILKNDKSITNFIKYKNCGYIKYQNEVVINIKDSNNQYILLESILLPGKEKHIPASAKKGDEFEILLYPVRYNFLADNTYFKTEPYSEMEIRYKLFDADEIRKLAFIKSENIDSLNEINGIMIYISELQSLSKFLEEIEFEYR